MPDNMPEEERKVVYPYSGEADDKVDGDICDEEATYS
jgi:hypothetical protein